MGSDRSHTPAARPPASVTEIDSRLRREADALRAVPPPDLADRMVQGFLSRDQVQVPARRLVHAPSRHAVRIAAAVLVSAALLLGGLNLRQRPAGPPAAAQPPQAMVYEGPVLSPPPAVRTTPLRTDAAAWVAPIDAPLVDEWQKLDAQIRDSATYLIARIPRMDISGR